MNGQTKPSDVTPILHRLPGLLDQFHSHNRQMPEVRQDEFLHLFETANMINPNHILEFLAENNEVARYYPNANTTTVDLFVTESMRLRGVKQTDWILSGIEDTSVDLILSLAPMHHANDNEQLDWLKACNRVLQQNGVLAFADVYNESTLHRFLDGFVNAHTCTGHTGNYLKEDIDLLLKKAGFSSVDTHIHRVTWKFSDLQHMGEFLASALAVQHTRKAIVDAAVEELGIKREGEHIFLYWPLMYVRASKTSDLTELSHLS
jgi:SAM-dependent methyltransferase